MAEHSPQHPLDRHSSEFPETWDDHQEDRDDWEERPREVAFWTVPILIAMLAFAIIIISFWMMN